ncbi:MAG: hypothetical protein HONBIEJF_00576 [Fimbriimonadaceae bacterium]|nr:hypothetical protein [Fimbriimonadaceae bacterium]
MAGFAVDAGLHVECRPELVLVTIATGFHSGEADCAGGYSGWTN